MGTKWMTTRVHNIWSDMRLNSLNVHWDLFFCDSLSLGCHFVPWITSLCLLKAMFAELCLFPFLFFSPLPLQFIFTQMHSAGKNVIFTLGGEPHQNCSRYWRGITTGSICFWAAESLLIYGLCFQKRSLVDMYSLMGSWFSDTLARTITTTKQCLDLSVVMETTLISAYCAPEREYLH